eukprot:3303-Heterococcus_DN1.PRE.3
MALKSESSSHKNSSPHYACEQHTLAMSATITKQLVLMAILYNWLQQHLHRSSAAALSAKTA